jgi:hypothetical protein
LELRAKQIAAESLALSIPPLPPVAQWVVTESKRKACTHADTCRAGPNYTTPSFIFLSSHPIPELFHTIKISLNATDQGWGNVGSSAQIRLAKSGKAIGWYQLPHQKKSVSLSLTRGDASAPESHQAFISSMSPGEIIQIVLISAPYPGFQAVGYESKIELF